MVPRRWTTMRELAYWRSQAVRTRTDRIALALMILIFVVGLIAVWSV